METTDELACDDASDSDQICCDDDEYGDYCSNPRDDNASQVDLFGQ